MLKLIFPNLLKIGRINKRALSGPIKLPKGPNDLIERVERAYKTFFKVWNITMIPKLLKMHKWYDGKGELNVQDIVYFRKQENDLSSEWTVGRIAEVVKGRDGKVRRATVEYQNPSEETLRSTDRAARSLVRLFNIDDTTWQQEMDMVAKLIDVIKAEETTEAENEVSSVQFTLKPVGESLKYKVVSTKSNLKVK